MKAVLFDFDGVIADTFDFSLQIMKRQIPGLTEQGYRDRFNGNIFANLTDVEPVDKPAEKFDFWAGYNPEIVKKDIDPDIKLAIDELASHYDLFIVSSTLSQTISEFLSRHGIRNHFKEILGSDVHKSKIYKIDLILEKYKLDALDCLFVTDTIGDILEARKCGMRSVAVTWGYHKIDALASVDPEGIVDSPLKLASEIKQMLDG